MKWKRNWTGCFHKDDPIVNNPKDGESKIEQIVIVVEIKVAHDWCKIRRLLKCLLRSYGLKCIDIGKK